MRENADRTAATLYGAISYHYEDGRDNHPAFGSVEEALLLIIARVELLKTLLDIPLADQSKWDIGRRLLQIAGIVQKVVVQRNLPYATVFKDQKPRTDAPAPPCPPARNTIPPSGPI